MENVYIIDFEENPEKYRAFIRAIQNLEMIFGGSFLRVGKQFYDLQPEPGLGYESDKENDLETKSDQVIENK